MAEKHQLTIKGSRDKKNEVKKKIERLEKEHEETMRQIMEEKEE